jgi:hypothetical protein
MQAKIPNEASRDLVPEMLQSLLSDRFRLKLRRETKEHSFYGLVAGPGFELEPLPADPPGVTPKQASAKMTATLEIIFAQKVTMLQFADFLSHWADRPVLDATDQSGPFAVALRITIREAVQTPGATFYVANSSALNPTQERRALEKIDEGKRAGIRFSIRLRRWGFGWSPQRDAGPAGRGFSRADSLRKLNSTAANSQWRGAKHQPRSPKLFPFREMKSTVLWHGWISYTPWMLPINAVLRIAVDNRRIAGM